MNRRRDLMHKVEDGSDIWLPVADSLSTNYSSYVVIDNDNDSVTFRRGSTNWTYFAMFTPLSHTYGDLAGKRIRCSFDYTITGNVGSNRGIVLAISEWPNANPSPSTANDRKSFRSLPDAKDASGHWEWEEALDYTTFNNQNLHSDNNYMGGMIYLMAGSSVSAVVTNLKYEYLL